MPIYEYRCRNGHVFEASQSMSDDPLAACEVCRAPVERVFHPVAIHFKGSGFYTTDYARKGAAKAGADGGEKKDSGEKKGSEAESNSSSGGDKKAAAKSGSD